MAGNSKSGSGGGGGKPSGAWGKARLDAIRFPVRIMDVIIFFMMDCS
jgi:hypothetical protein